MPIDMSSYKMIYNDQVFNVVSIVPTFYADTPRNDLHFKKAQFIEAFFIDEDGELKSVQDEAWCFKFVRR